MIRFLLAASLVAPLLLLLGSTAQALYCQNRIVAVGDPSVRVRELCGDPADIVERVEHRERTIHRRAADGVVISDSFGVSVVVETWTYDFGPQRFMHALTFEDGRLRRIRALGYGTARSAMRDRTNAAFARTLPAGLWRRWGSLA